MENFSQKEEGASLLALVNKLMELLEWPKALGGFILVLLLLSLCTNTADDQWTRESVVTLRMDRTILSYYLAC